MKIKGISLLAFVFVVLGLTSCFHGYVANYSVGLSTVECPVDVKQQFGETKVVNVAENGVSDNHYEDDNIDIVWRIDNKTIYFYLVNKTSRTIKINWDDISYVDTKGQVVGVAPLRPSKPTTTVPHGAKFSDFLLPAEHFYFRPRKYGYGGVEELYLIPCFYLSLKDYKTEAPLLIGKTMKVMMPIMIQNVQNDYTFTFTIDKLLNVKNETGKYKISAQKRKEKTDSVYQ